MLHDVDLILMWAVSRIISTCKPFFILCMKKADYIYQGVDNFNFDFNRCLLVEKKRSLLVTGLATAR